MIKPQRLLPALVAAMLLMAWVAVEGGVSGEAPPSGRPDPTNAEIGAPARRVAALPSLHLVGCASAPRPPKAKLRGDAVVTVIGPGGPKVRVWLDVFLAREHAHLWKYTNEAGQVHLADVPYDGSVRVVVDGLPASLPPDASASISRATATIGGPKTRIMVADTLPLEVTFTNVATGAPLPDLPFRLESSEAFLSEPTRRVKTRPGHILRVSVNPEALPGLVAFDGVDVTVDISRRAKALRLGATLRPEALVHLRAIDAEGRAVPDADVDGIEVAGAEVYGATRGRREGDVFRVHGVPFLRRERIRLLATRPSPCDLEGGEEEEGVDCEWSECLYLEGSELEDDVWRGIPAPEPGFAAIACGRLPARREIPLLLTAVFDPALRVLTCDQMFGGGHGDGFYRHDPRPTGHVEVSVVDGDGRPIRGTEVRLWRVWTRTDLDGRAWFQDVPEGEHTLVLLEPGWVRTRQPVLVHAGETTPYTLIEDEGGEVLVRVLGEEDGLPLAGARIAVPDSAAWADIEDGVQRLDVATDFRGERLLRRYPTGETTIRVRWGRRRGSGTIKVLSRLRKTLVLRLAPEAVAPAPVDPAPVDHE